MAKFVVVCLPHLNTPVEQTYGKLHYTNGPLCDSKESAMVYVKRLEEQVPTCAGPHLVVQVSEY